MTEFSTILMVDDVWIEQKWTWWLLIKRSREIYLFSTQIYRSTHRTDTCSLNQLDVSCMCFFIRRRKCYRCCFCHLRWYKQVSNCFAERKKIIQTRATFLLVCRCWCVCLIEAEFLSENVIRAMKPKITIACIDSPADWLPQWGLCFIKYCLLKNHEHEMNELSTFLC